jgi:acetyltransferase-like isoleucine patch superfamily enzyme
MITDISHGYSQLDTGVMDQPLEVGDVEVGDYCFLGMGCRIMPGTKLGKQCVVGANAVVMGEYPDYCVLVGSPARIVKRYNKATQSWQKTDSNGVFYNE